VGGERNTCRFLARKPGVKRPREIPRRILDDNIKVGLREIM
jgi:hypothetical protein